MAGRVNVVLFEPEIPQNTGNIMRTCVAADCSLHLIGPLGFDINNKKFKRATTNHITWADYDYYESFDEFVSKNKQVFLRITALHTSVVYTPSDISVTFLLIKK